MLKLLKIIPWKKLRYKRKIRSADELFSDGKIFEAKNKELDMILKELTKKDSIYSTVQDRNIIRAITVLTVKNNKYTNLVQFFLIILTLFSLYLAWRQTNYAEIASIPVQIEQNSIIREAIDRCKQNSDLADSGLSWTNGKKATCKEVLNSKQIKDFVQ